MRRRANEALALEIARGAIHRRDNGQTGNDSETSDDLMGGVINASHRRAVQHDTNQNQMIEE